MLLPQSTLCGRTSSLSTPHRLIAACKSLSRHDLPTSNLSASICVTRYSEQTISKQHQTLPVDRNYFKSARLRCVYKILQHHFLPLATSPSRRCQRRASAFKCLFPLHPRRAHFNHNYSPLTRRFLSHPIHLIFRKPSSPADLLTRCSASWSLE